MIIIPLQSFGVGDIIYCQTLIKKLAGGEKTLWPAESQFVAGLNKAYPDVLFIDKKLVNIDFNRKDDYIIGEAKIIPISWTYVTMNVEYKFCMRSKYDRYGLDHLTWKERAMWQRDRHKEEELFKLLGCDKGPYVFLNCTFGSESQLRIPAPNLPNLNRIEMKTIPGYSLFDWAMVWENATEFHSVSTSIIYCIEQLELKAKEVHLYCRKPIERNFDNIEYILQKHNYVCHL